MNRLSARAVKTAGAGYHADGGGLYLLVSKAGTASWVFRYRRKEPGDPPGKAGRLREAGLGSASVFTLAEARERAALQRKLLADGLDPIQHKAALRAVTPRLWGEAKAEFIEAQRAGWKNPQQARQWKQSLDDYGPADDVPVQQVDTELVLGCLQPLWSADGKLETATRLRGRIERIIDAEKVRGRYVGDNPARWRGHLEHLLAKPGKVKRRRHHAAMPYADAPAFMADLRAGGSRSRRALEFTILTVARTEEVLGAEWREFDLARALWTIPPERMKSGEEHVVPLQPRAVEILRELPQDAQPFRLSENTMLYLLQRAPPKGMGRPYTVHGFRSTFHNWASEQGHAEHLIDMALAHKVSDEVKAAYRRTKLLALRRELLLQWAGYLATAPPDGHSRA